MPPPPHPVTAAAAVVWSHGRPACNIPPLGRSCTRPVPEMAILGVDTNATVLGVHATAARTTVRGVAKEYAPHRRIASLLLEETGVSLMMCRIELQALPVVRRWAQQQLRETAGCTCVARSRSGPATKLARSRVVRGCARAERCCSMGMTVLVIPIVVDVLKLGWEFRNMRQAYQYREQGMLLFFQPARDALVPCSLCHCTTSGLTWVQVFRRCKQRFR